jgi:hypothetical protein
MASWGQFVTAAPRLATQVRVLFEQYGRGFGYLATVRADGGPRVHPVSPVFTGSGLFVFVIRSPKQRDLRRDGRYALHSFPAEESDLEAYLAGRALPVTEPSRVGAVAAQVGAGVQVDWRLFELTVEVAATGSPGRRHQVWRQPRTGGGTYRVPGVHAPAPAGKMKPIAGVVQWQNISFPS